MTALIVGIAIGFIVGFLVFRNNAAKAAKMEDKTVDILKALKGK